MEQHFIHIYIYIYIGKTPDTGKEAVRSYWCPEYNVSSFTIIMYMKAALWQVAEFMHLYV